MLKKNIECTKVFVMSCALRLKEAGPAPKITIEKASNNDPSAEPERCGVILDFNEFDLTKPLIGGAKSEPQGPARGVRVEY